jgi:Glyoxalase/Bleomycin resistance protein/Dioxygenase superfamily
VTLQIVELVVGDDPGAWRAAGFTVDEAGCAQVSTVRFRFVGAGGQRGIRSWGVAGLESSDVDGLTGGLLDPIDVTPYEHANTTMLLDHLVVATPDIDRTVRAFVERGCEPRRERVGGAEEQPLRQVFLRAGEVIVEVVGPVTAPHRSEHRERPASFWGLAFTVADLDACVASLAEHCGSPRDAVQAGRRIATLRHESLGISVPTAFMTL